MNKIFKVIWSTSKQCYVVVSEVANNKSGKKKIVVASILAALAAQSVGVMDVAAADVPSTAIANAIPTTGKTNGFAAGNEANASSNQSVAIGYKSSASAANPSAGQAELPATAVGAGANADGKAALALGLASSAGERSTAVGSSSKASGFGAFAGGVGAQAQGRGAVAIGGGSTATYNNTTGYVYNDNAAATASDAVAIGTGAKAEQSNAISIGYHSNAKAGNSLAVGSEAAATGEGSVAVGRKNTASGASAIAMGILANATGTSSTALGMQATASGNNTVAIGPSAKAIADDSIAVGTNNTVAEKGVAIGKNVKAKASTYENMVVGIDSEASGAGGAMAVGMKVKTTGMDAVTVGRESQATGAWGVAVGRKANATGSTSVALGTDVTASGGNSAAMGSNATSSGPGSLAIGSGTGDATTALGANAIAVGTSSVAATNNAIAMGNGAVANGSDAIVIGRASKTESTANTVQAIVIGSNAYVGPQTAQSIAIGSGNMTGQGATVTGDQSIAIGGNVIVPGHSAIAIGGDDVIKAMNAQVTYTSKDGQTISNQNLRAAYGALTGKNITGFVRTTASHGGVAYGVSAKAGNGGVAVGMGADSYSRAGSSESLTNAVALGMGARATLDNSVAIGGGSNTDHSATSQTHANVNGIEVHWQGGANIKPGDVVSFGGDGYERQLKNVAPGEVSATSTDAVNGSQLFSVANTAFTNTWKLSANGDATTETINKGETVDFSGDNNITIDRTGKKITTKLNKTINLDAVNVGSATGNRASLTANGLSATAGSTTVKFGADEINAGGKQIKNVSSGGNIGTNAANITDVKNAVAGVNLKLTDGSHNGTVNLDQDTLRIASGTGINASVNGKSISVALNKDGQTALTSGIGLRGNSGATGYKYLKDGNVAFDIKGDGSLVTTSASPAGGVSIAVNGDKVKDIALTAVTASSDVRQQNNPIKVSPIAGTHSMDYAISIDRDKLAKITDLTYRANSAADANAKKISLAKGLDFVDGTSTSASINTDGKVSFDLNSATKTKIDTTATAVGRNITLAAETGTPSSQSLTNGNVTFAVNGAANDYISTKMNGSAVEIATKRATITSNPTTGQASVTGADGLATAKNVADAINAAANRAAAGATWNVTTNSSAADTTAVSSGDTVDFVAGDNIEIKQDSSNKKKITVATKKNVSFDTATIGANTTIGTAGITTNKVTAGNVTTDKVVVGPVSIDKNDGINAGNKQITNLASGGAVASNAATIGDVQNAVANLSQNLNITDGSNNGTVNLKTQTLTVTGTGAAKATVNGQTITLDVAEGALTSDTNGVVTGTTGLAKAPEVAAAINKVNTVLGDKIDQNKTDIATNTRHIANTISLDGESGSTTAKSLKDGNVSFKIKGDGKYLTTAAAGNDVTLSVDEQALKDTAKEAATFKVKANNTAAEDVKGGDTITFKDGDNIEITQNGKTFTVATKKNVSFDTATIGGNTTIGTAGITTNKVTAGNVTTDKLVVGPVSIDKNDGINAGNKQITNLVSGGAVASNAATIGDVQNAVANLSQNLNITDGSNNGTVNLKTQTLTVTGTGAAKATVNGQTITLDVAEGALTSDTNGVVTGTTGLAKAPEVAAAINKVNTVLGDKIDQNKTDIATNTRHIANTISLDGESGSTTAKSLKDGNVSFKIKGDGKYVTTDASGENVTVKVSEEAVKKSAVSAVTVSTDAAADNPLTVTGTTSPDGTSKEYKVSIDGSKLAAKTNLTYKANGTSKQVSLADGLDFTNGTMTTASVDDNGVVKYDVNTASITAGTDGTVTGPSTDGVATAKNVADAINAAKKASTTVITANGGESANGTSGSIKLTSTTGADGHTIYDVALNDTVTIGAGTNAIALDGTNGTITGKKAKMGDVTVNGDDNTITGLSNKTWNGTPVSGRAATEDQLKAVADAAANQTWKITADKVGTSGKQTGTKTDAVVGKDQTVQLVAGDNLTIDQDDRKFTYSLNKDLVNMTSASFEAAGGKTSLIKGDSITQSDNGKTHTSTASENALADGNKSNKTTADGNTITDGVNTNTVTATSNSLADNAGNSNVSNATSNTLKNAAGDQTQTEAQGVTVKDAAGNNTTLTKDGLTITKAGKAPVSLTSDGLNNGGNKISNIADGVADHDAVNVSQLNAKTKAATTELTANGGQAANGTSGNIVLKKTLAADGHTVYDNALNDTITLGASDPTKSVTLDGKTGKVTAGSGTDAVAIDGTNGTVKAGDKVTLNGKDGKATIGSVGIDGKDGILATGGTNPVAVNGKDGVVTGLTNKDWDPNNITSGRAATEDQVKKAVADSGWIAKVGTEGTGVNATPSANPETIKTNETLAFNAGNNVVVSQSGKTISYALNPELKDMKSATFKDGDGNTTVTNGNGMTITPGAANPTNPNAGPVSLTKDGLNNGNNQLKGIAPGTDDTDAVNVAQLRQSNANISQAIDKVASETQRVGAQAAAMAALKPIQYDPLEPTQIMAGIGNYRGETAAALGLAHYTNENTMFNVGVSIGNNHNMVNAGVTHKFGTSAERKNIPDRYKAGPISSIYVMQDEMTQLRSENTAYKTKLEQQQSEIDALKEAVHQLLAAKA